jgi:hypothetical protein
MVSFVHISIGVVKQQGISTSNQIKLNHLPLFIEVSVPRQESERYNQPCIKRSPLGQRKNWPFKTGNLLNEVKFI